MVSGLSKESLNLGLPSAAGSRGVTDTLGSSGEEETSREDEGEEEGYCMVACGDVAIGLNTNDLIALSSVMLKVLLLGMVIGLSLIHI